MIPFTAAEVFGYYGRYLASKDPAEVGPFIIQNLLLLSAAPFLAATVYMSLARIILALDARRHALISPRWVTFLYVTVDIGCIATQIAGSIIPASGDPDATVLAQKLLTGGLVAQIVALGFFVLMCWYVHRRVRRETPNKGSGGGGGGGVSGLLRGGWTANWENYFRALEAVTILILVRSVVRSVEFLQGPEGVVASHEVFVYLFDAVLMMFVMLAFLILHPGRLTRDARKLKEQQGDGTSDGYDMLERQGSSRRLE